MDNVTLPEMKLGGIHPARLVLDVLHQPARALRQTATKYERESECKCGYETILSVSVSAK